MSTVSCRVKRAGGRNLIEATRPPSGTILRMLAGELCIGPPMVCELHRDKSKVYATVDCSQEDWKNYTDTGLFSRPLLLLHLEEIHKKDMALVANILALRAGNRGEGTKIAKELLKSLENKTNIHDLTFKTKDLNIKLWQQIGGYLGVRLNVNCIKELNNRLGHDIDRALSVVISLGIGGWVEPTVKQIAVLAGTNTKVGLPWEALGYAEKGDWDSVRALIPMLEPIPTIAYIGKRCLTSLVLARDPLIGEENLNKYVGDTTSYARSGAKQFADNIGQDGLQNLMKSVVRADYLAKRGQGEAALMHLLGSLSSVTVN